MAKVSESDEEKVHCIGLFGAFVHVEKLCLGHFPCAIKTVHAGRIVGGSRTALTLTAKNCKLVDVG